jgi:epoxyqueuosine reductase
LNNLQNRIVTHGTDLDTAQLWPQVCAWAQALGFARVGVTGIDLSDAEPRLMQWLAAGFHGGMAYMAAHGAKRARPAELVPGTVSIITARMNYLPGDTSDDWRAAERGRLSHPQEGVVSLYARGRDYHKVMRQRLQALQRRIAQAIGPFGHRVFSDSAPVLEAELARRAALGWRGKHTLLIAPDAGSMFFLGELFVDFALPAPEPAAPVNAGHCGGCRACLDACPTQAIVQPGLVDARRCISYLTIEHGPAIPENLRPLIGNRIYGCDDCQLVCPWNKFARRTPLPDFDPRPGLTGTALTALLAWDEAEFLRRTQGSPIRRIGHARWLRNVAVALGNALSALAPGDARRAPLMAALAARASHPDPLVREHVHWALAS